MAIFVNVLHAGKNTRYCAKPRHSSELTLGKLRFLRRLKVQSSEMDPAEIRFIRKALIKGRGFKKIRPSSIPWASFKESATPCTAVGNSEMNCQRGNEIYRTVGIGDTCVFFSKLWTEFLQSLCWATCVFALVFTRPVLAQGHNRPATSITEQEFIAPLSMLRRDHSAIVYSNSILGLKCTLRHCKQIPNLFIVPLPTALCSR